MKDLDAALGASKDKLNMLGMRAVTVLVTKVKKDPHYYSFPQCKGFHEDPLCRGMRPTFHHLLKLGRLIDNYALERLPAVGRNTHINVGLEGTARRNAAQVVFVHGIIHTPGLTTVPGARRALMQGLDELDRAKFNSKFTTQSSSRIYIRSLPEVEGSTPPEVANKFDVVNDKLKVRLVQRLLKLNVNTIEAKVRVMSIDEDGNPMVIPVRLMASSMEGKWHKTAAYTDKPNPIICVTREFCLIGDGKEAVCVLDPYDGANIIQTKRAIAHCVGSTYAYDFLGILEVGMLQEWEAYLGGLDGADTPTSAPANLFEARELLEGRDGGLVLDQRKI